MHELSPKAGELADEMAAGLNLLRHVLDSIEEVESGPERAAISREMQGTCERFSQAAARARRAAVRFMRDEGLTLDEIASAIGVSRPRVSEMLRP